MWNYNFVLPSFAILLILLVYYVSRPQVSIRINRTFIVLLLIDCLVIIFDILSSEADSNAQIVPLLPNWPRRWTLPVWILSSLPTPILYIKEWTVWQKPFTP